SGGQGDREGITHFLVPADAGGVGIKRYKTVDAQGAAEITLTDVRVDGSAVLGEVDSGFEALAATVDEATLAICAEALGIMQIMHDKTVEYCKSRVQFGVPIGSFQALQHRMVETLMLCEQTRSLLYWAVMLCQDKDPEASNAISALKYQIGTAGKRVAQEAVQLHGGMGVTWELDIAHYFKRHSVIETLFGHADLHLDRFASAA
ncbi:MAG: acyl-CoA dehydrogenase family protein, partial [Pseudomonadota bacterium]